MITIATLNTWGIPFVRDRHRRMQALALEIASGKYDIVGLQEIWDMEDLERMQRGAELGGFAYTHHFKSGHVGSGLVVLSRYPIVELDFHRYRLRGTAETVYYGDYIAGKGIGLARIQTPDGLLNFYITHLIAQYEADDRDQYVAHRAAQMFEAARFINHRTAATAPAVMVGDFNVRPDQLGYRIITTLAGMRDVYDALHPGDAGYTLSNDNLYVHAKSERIDYMMTRGGVQAESIQIAFQGVPGTSIPYSDHYGLVMRCRLADAESTSTVDIQPVLVEILDVLQAGLTDARRRQAHRVTRFQIGLLAFVAVHLLPRRVMLLARPLTLLHLLIQRWLARYFIQDEIGDLQEVLAEVETLVYSS